MDTANMLKKSHAIIELWEKELYKYDFKDLLKKPGPDSWSLGQVYMHLISATLDFHLKQIDICQNGIENQFSKKNFKGFMAYNILHGFPPIKIKVPPSDSYTPSQPVSLEEIKAGLRRVKEKTKAAAEGLSSKKSVGKTAHPGFSYLNAEEWFALIEMHFKHHLRQKERILAFLKDGQGTS